MVGQTAGRKGVCQSLVHCDSDITTCRTAVALRSLTQAQALTDAHSRATETTTFHKQPSGAK